jgi:hypothetical protein
MRIQCPNCATWQPAEVEPGAAEAERSCSRCGELLRLTRQDSEQGPQWVAAVRPSAAVALDSEATLRELLQGADEAEPAARAEQLTGVRAQLVALTACSALRLWLPAALLVALGLALGIALVVVGQRIEGSLALLLAPLAVGLVAWTMVLAASAVAHLLHVRLQGTAVGMARSLRMMLEHGNGAAGSSLRFVILGACGATACALVALLGAVPGLAGPAGLAVTSALLWLQLLAVGAALGLLLLMVLALLLHPGLAVAGPLPAGRMFRFVLGLLRRDSRALVRQAAPALVASAGLLVVGYAVLRVALLAVAALNARVLGPRYADLLAASPLRVLFGTPELLDPGRLLGLGGLLMALSLTLCAALVLGFVASFLGVSGYLLARGLDLRSRLGPP